MCAKGNKFESTRVTGSENIKILRRWDQAAKLIAKNGGKHTGEELIVPASKEMVRVVIGEEAAEQAKAISLPDNTVKWSFNDMAEAA